MATWRCGRAKRDPARASDPSKPMQLTTAAASVAVAELVCSWLVSAALPAYSASEVSVPTFSSEVSWVAQCRPQLPSWEAGWAPQSADPELAFADASVPLLSRWPESPSVQPTIAAISPAR